MDILCYHRETPSLESASIYVTTHETSLMLPFYLEWITPPFQCKIRYDVSSGVVFIRRGYRAYGIRSYTVYSGL